MDVVIKAIETFSSFLYWSIFIRIMISWFPIRQDNIILIFLNSITEPILTPIRNMIRKSPLGGPGMMIDFSGIVALLGLNILTSLLTNFLKGL